MEATLNTPPTKSRYGFTQYNQDLSKIIQKLKYPLATTHLYGVHRGGMVPAVHLSNVLGIPLNVIKYQRLDGNDHTPQIAIQNEELKTTSSVLVIDDIYDSGITMDKISTMFSSLGIQRVQLLTLFGKPNDVGVEYINEHDGEWVEFFWEVN